MTDYHVEWSIDVEDCDSAREAAQDAWDTVTRDKSIASVFVVSDDMDMTTVVDLHEKTSTEPVWMPSPARVADLAEWMHQNDWGVGEIIEMIRRPHKYADEYSKMVVEREFEKVAKEPEEADLDDIEVSSVTATFRPEVWVDDHAVEATVDWDQFEWNVSAETAKAIARQLTEKNRDWDWVRDDEFAHQWVKDWEGPFTIEILPDGHTFEEGVYVGDCQHCGHDESIHDQD